RQDRGYKHERTPLDIENCEVSSQSPMPTPRNQFATTKVDNFIFVDGGINASGSLAQVEKYDTRNGNWTEVAGMLHRRHGLALAQVGDDRLLAIGGWNGNLDITCIECYDMDTDQWTMISTGTLLNVWRGFAVALT